MFFDISAKRHKQKNTTNHKIIRLEFWSVEKHSQSTNIVSKTIHLEQSTSYDWIGKTMQIEALAETGKRGGLLNKYCFMIRWIQEE